ncbi:hypothetical protein [Ureaplasma ceti]|uniref:Uncharacterized protein n=1 Tax=Ureaplasma ceti TaxID=3119530 RepID=A0ABP9U503_9BACT
MDLKNRTLFFRDGIVTPDNQHFYDEIAKVLNLSTLENWTYKKTYKWFHPRFEREYLAYRFYVLRQWIKKNAFYNNHFVNTLQELLSILGLDAELTTREQQYIEHYKAVVFAKNRNIKNLIVDFQVNDKEEVWYRYDIEFLYQKIETKYVNLTKKSGIYFTNQRLIIDKGNDYISIYYKQLDEVKLHNNMLLIRANNLNLVVISSEMHTMYVSLERIGKLIRLKL